MLNTLKRLVIEEEGQGMAEYALILAFIAVACLAAYKALGTKINDEVKKVDFTTDFTTEE
jgi:pilus assembly protein Flp/PilA